MAETNTSTQNKQDNQVVIRNTSNLNNKFNKYGKNKKIQNIKNVFKNRGTLGTDFRKVFRFLKVYQNIVNKLLNKPEFMKYYTDSDKDKDTYNSSRASILTLLKKFDTYIDPNGVIDLKPYEIKNLPINENNLNLNEYGLEKEMYEFLKETKIPEEIKKFSPITYIADIPEYWKFLDNNLDNKNLYLMDELEKNNYVSQTGGEFPRKYYLDNASNKKEIQNYINDCSQNEYLYALKHIEYIQLFLFLKELVACNLNLNRSLQSILKLKFYNDEGNPIEIGDMLSVQLPKKQDFQKFLEQQKNVLDSTTRQYLDVLGDDKIDMIINDIYNQIKNEVTQILNIKNQKGGLINVRSKYGKNLEKFSNKNINRIQNKINEKLKKLQQNLQKEFEDLSDDNLKEISEKRKNLRNIFGNNIDKIFNDILSNREKKRKQEQAERKAKEEAERIEREEAKKKAREELDRKAKEEETQKIKNELDPFKNNIIQKYQEIKNLEEIKDDFFVLDQIYNIYKYIETNNLKDKLRLFDVKIEGENSLATLLKEIYESKTPVDLSKKKEINNLIKKKGGLSMTLGEGEEVIDINELKEEVYKIPGIIVKISDPHQFFDKDENNKQIYNNDTIKLIQKEYNERVRANDKNCVIIGKKCYGDGDAKPYGVYRKVVQPDLNSNPKNESLYDYMINDYNLANTISKGNHLKFFGYGFSGSGKTYTLLQGGKDDPSILSHLLIDLKNGNLKNNEDKVLEFNSLSIKVYYPLMDYDKTDTNEFYVNKERSTINDELVKISNELNEKMKSGSNDNLSVFVKENLEKVEKILNDNLLILPTTNNPNSSRAFTIVEVGIKDSGSVTFIDLPGLEKKVDMIRDHYISLPENESGTLNKYIQKQINNKSKESINPSIKLSFNLNGFNESYKFLYGKEFGDGKPNEKTIITKIRENIILQEKNFNNKITIKLKLINSFFDNTDNTKFLFTVLKTYYKLEKLTIEKFFQKDEEQKKNETKLSLIYQNYVIDILNYINYQTNLVKDYVYELPYDVSTFIETFKKKFLKRKDFKLKDNKQTTIKEILYGKDYESILFNIFKISKDKKDSYFTLFDEKDFDNKFPNNKIIKVDIYKNPALTVLNALFSLIDNEITSNNKILYSKLKLVFLVMYTKFTLDQGGAIVSSLEHLLFLFLNQIPEGVNKYNDKHKDRPFEKFQNNTYGESTYNETVNSGMVESIMRKPSKGMNKILGIGDNEDNKNLRFINLLTILRAEYSEFDKDKKTYTNETIKQKRCQGAKETVDFGSTLVMADNSGCGGTEIKSDIQIKNNSKERHNILKNKLNTKITQLTDKINKLNNEDIKKSYLEFIAQINNRTFKSQNTNQTGGKTKSLKNRIGHRHTKNPSKKNRFYKGGANNSTQQNEFDLETMAKNKINELFPNAEENENEKRKNLLIKKLESVLKNEKIKDKDTTYKSKILDKYLEALKIENFKSVADNANTVGTVEERNFIHRKSKTVENFGETLETIHKKFITNNIKDILKLEEKLDLTQLQVQSGGQNNNLNKKLTQLEELMRKIEDLKKKKKEEQEKEVQEINANAEVAQKNTAQQETQETNKSINTTTNTPAQQETNTQEQENPAENLAAAASALVSASGQKGGKLLKVKNETTAEQLQTFLDRCYNLQNLYLIKHYEVMEILKPIVYYLDVLGKNTLLFVYVLSMYGKEETISGETLEKEISFLPQYQNFIKKINDLLKDQKKINVIMKDIKKDEKGLKNQTKDAKLGNSSSSQEGGKLNKTKKTKKNQKNKKKNTQKRKLSKKNRSK